MQMIHFGTPISRGSYMESSKICTINTPVDDVVNHKVVLSACSCYMCSYINDYEQG